MLGQLSTRTLGAFAALCLTLGVALAQDGSPSGTDAAVAVDPALGADGGLTDGVWPLDGVMGPVDAPVVVVEYASWTCPFCARFHAQAVNPVIKPLADEGLVRFISRDFLRNGIDFRAGMIARCVEQGVDFWEAAEAFYFNQKTYATNDVQQVDFALMSLAQLDPNEYVSCLENESTAQWLVDRSQEAQALGVDSTPTVFINAKRLDLADVPRLEEILRAAAAEAVAPAAE